MSVAIEIKDLWFSYGDTIILQSLSFEVFKGEFLAIAGPNGAGKTTLLNLLCGLLQPETGHILIDSTGIESYSSKSLARKVAVVRQEFVPIFDFSVTAVVSMGRTPYLSALGFESEEDKTIVSDAMQITDTKRFCDRSLRQLSGGERQRVFIARALAQQTPILLLDEPTSFLDLKHQVGIYDLLKDTQLEKHKTIVAVTHDINLAIQYCDRALLLSNARSHYVGGPDEVFSTQRIEAAFGVKTFTGELGREKFFMPIGTSAKSAYLLEEKTHKQRSKG